MAKAKRRQRPRPSATPEAGDLTGHTPRLSKYQAFKPKRIPRSAIKEAFYNPRLIDKERRENLKGVLRKLGLFNALVWNERTGNLVAGHQRLQIIDQLEGTPDYSLDVDVVDVDDKTEREMNLAHNNRGAQGDDDLAKMAELFKSTKDLDLSAAGYNTLDVEMMFGEDSDVSRLFTVKNASPVVQAIVGELEGVNAQERPKRNRAQDSNRAQERKAPEKHEPTPEEIDRIKAAKKQYRKDAAIKDDTEFYALVVCRDREDRERFMVELDVNPDERMVSVERLRALLCAPMGVENSK